MHGTIVKRISGEVYLVFNMAMGMGKEVLI